MPPLSPDVASCVREAGVQLWTVRDAFAADPAGTLATLQGLGYRQVELMDVVSQSAHIPAARQMGLQVQSAFIDFRSVLLPPDDGAPSAGATLDLAVKHGLKYLVFGYIPQGLRETVALYQQHAEALNRFGRQCRQAGVRLCYHHHSFEFARLEAGSTTGWDVLRQELSPDSVEFEIDVFWAALGGHEPHAFLRSVEGRVAQVHLKDLAAGTPTTVEEHTVAHAAFKELGAGCLPIAELCATAYALGVRDFHVEQDQSPDPFVSLRTSRTFLDRL